MAEVGRLIAGQYRLIEKIGRGGFGVVWRAHDERLDREVAVKELYLPTYLGDGQRRERRNRSLREARSAARIDHRGAVTVYDVVEEDECPFIVMEYLKGRSLEDIVKTDGPLPVHQAAEIGLQLLETLRAAHAAGVVHRDVKPSNVIVTEKRAVLTDFGIATIEGEISITQSGFVMGAPAYCSPERAKGDRARPASDLWSLGATLYYAVEGHQPFPGSNANQVFHTILTAPHRPTHRAGLLGPLLDGLLIKEIDQRFTASDTALLLAGATQPGARGPREHLTLPSRSPRAARLRRFRRNRFFAPVLALAVITAATLTWTGRDDPPGKAEARAEKAAPGLDGTLPVGAERVQSLAVSRDGRQLAVGTEGKAVQLWDLNSQKLLRTLDGPANAIFGLVFSPDGAFLAGGGYDGEAYLWDLSSFELDGRMRLPHETVHSVGFSRDGGRLIIASNNQLTEWDVDTHKRIKVTAGAVDAPYAVAVSAQGTVAYTSVRGVWLAGRRLGPAADIQPVMRFSPDGSWLATGGSAGRVSLWQDGRVAGTVPGTGYTIKDISFAPSGRLLATADAGTIRLWKTDGWTEQTSMEATATVNAVAFRSDDLLAVGTEAGDVELWTLG